MLPADNVLSCMWTQCYFACEHIWNENKSFNSSTVKPKQEAEAISKTYGLFNKGFLILQDGTDRLPRNVGKELPLLAA